MAEPLSLIASVGAIAGTCLSISRELAAITQSYKAAPPTIRSLSNECTTTVFMLNHTKQTLYDRADLFRRDGSRSEVIEMLELAVEDIHQTTRDLSKELAKLKKAGNSFRGRTMFVFNEGTLKAYVQLLRDQRGSIDNILKCMQTETLSTIRSHLMRSGTTASARSSKAFTPLVRETRPKGKANRINEIRRAISADKVDALRSLLEDGADPDTASGKFEYTPLHFAAQSGRCQIIECLAEFSADFDSKAAGDLYTPLMVALHNKHAEAVKTLLHVGANPSAETSLGNTALHLAVSKGLVNITTILLEAGADPNYANIRGATALRHAVDYTTPQIYSSLTPPSSYEDVVECIRTLFKFGADPNLADTSDEVPLHLAVESDRLEIPRLLLKSNAHVDALGGKKRTPLHYAAMSDTESAPNMCLLLIKVGADLELFSDDHDTPLRAAVKKSNTNVAKILLEAGANPNAFQDAECCPVTYALHSAVQAGPAAIVNMLLYHGAEVTARDKTLSTALHCACEHSSNEIAATLLNHPGIDINAQDSAGNTPFLVATMMYNLKLMRLLIGKGANIHLTNKDNGDAMNFASHPLVASFLLGRGFNLNRRDNDGATALHFAAREGNPEHVQWLLEMGADATIHTVCCNDLTGTPADIARQCDHDSTVEVLEAWVKEHDRHAYSSWNLALTKFEEEGDDGEEEGAPSESST